jgi:ABC-2 type transport system ATP-binding protein
MEEIETDLENNNTSEIIQVENLKKNYNGFTALKGISFSVKRGEIFGFLGPNGAGKTTTINILATLILPTSGVVYVNGYNVLSRPDMVRKSIGMVFQEVTLDTHLTAEENLYLHAYLYGVLKKEFNQRKREVLKLCELWEKRKWKVENFSGGMKRRLEIARALIHWPKILFLDEPTVGLDPQTRTKIWDYIFSTRKQKDTTIFLTTQYLNEAENCDRIAIIDHGEIVALDTPENLKKMVGGDIIIFKTLDNDLAEKEFRAKFPQYKLKRIGKELKIEVENGDEFLPTLVKTITPKIISIELRRPTLEDVFLEVTGRKIREDEEPEPEEEPFNLASLFSLFNNKKNK